MYTFTPVLPPVSRDVQDICKMAGAAVIGLDLEWAPGGEPTILGLSDGKTTVSVRWDEGVDYLRWLIEQSPDAEWVMHNGISADLSVLDKMGIHIPLEQVADSIVWMWLTNMHLAKASGKSAMAEDEGERRGRGFFNLGTLLSLYTDIWHYKECRGEGCSGPCPVHEEFWYNAIDALGPVLALPGLKSQARIRRVDHLYPMHRKLAYVLAQMQDYGVKVDGAYIETLNETFERQRAEIEQTLPFNPNSPKQVVAHFKEWGLKDAQVETVDELVEELGEAAPAELVSLVEYKDLGNGTDRWFKPQYRDDRGWLRGYRDENDFIHGRLNMFTSSSRLAMSSPNLQNAEKRRGEAIRKGIVAPEGWYIVRADYSNAENRAVLHFGGYSIPRDLDLHTWVGEMSGLTEEMEFVQRTGGGKIRQAAKSIQHANNILEGLQLKTLGEINGKRIKEEIKAGARIVYPNWKFRGRIVTFTGVNLSRRVYGDATREHRRDALEISGQYFARFPGIREFQRRVSRACEIESAVRTPLGYCLLSFGNDEDRMKIAQGVWQQQPISHIMKLAIIRSWERWEREQMMRPVLSIHDELLCYCRDEVPPATAMRWIQEDMEFTVPEIPNLLIPCEPTWGPTWAESDQLSA